MKCLTDNCSRCHLRATLCLCRSAPALTVPIQLLLLTHEREPAKLSNTGRLLEAALPDCSLEIWQRRESAGRLHRRLVGSGLSPLLIFPGRDGSADSEPELVALSSFQSAGETNFTVENTLFILLDATWQQAAKMVRRTPFLQQLPRVQLPITVDSQYLLRRNQQPGNLSTVEAGIVLLKVLGFSDDSRHLADYFQQFLRHYEAQRSNHTLSL